MSQNNTGNLKQCSSAWRHKKTDQKMSFYAGLNSLKLFHTGSYLG